MHCTQTNARGLDPARRPHDRRVGRSYARRRRPRHYVSQRRYVGIRLCENMFSRGQTDQKSGLNSLCKTDRASGLVGVAPPWVQHDLRIYVEEGFMGRCARHTSKSAGVRHGSKRASMPGKAQRAPLTQQ